MSRVGRGAAVSAVVLAVGLTAAPAGAVSARADQDGSPVSSAPASSVQKVKRCKGANRVVTVTARATKSIAGQTYGVEAARTVSLCTTRKNRTTVYSSSLALTAISGGLATVKASAGGTTRSTLLGMTSLTTPLTAKAHWLFTTYHVVGTLVTTVDGHGKVTSQIVDVTKV